MSCIFCSDLAVAIRVFFAKFVFSIVYWCPILLMISAISLTSGFFLRKEFGLKKTAVRVGFYCLLGAAVAFVQHAVVGVFADLITPIITVVAVLSQTIGKMKNGLEPPVNDTVAFVAAGAAIVSFVISFVYFYTTIDGIQVSVG